MELTRLLRTVLESDVTRLKVHPQIDCSRWPNVLPNNPATSCVFSATEFSDTTGSGHPSLVSLLGPQRTSTEQN